VADGNFIVPQRMVQALVSVAERGTDAGAIHQSRGCVLTGIVSVPCR
jgi:putative aminopeptidase FrvX